MCIQNMVKFCPFILKIWSKNLILESIKGQNSVANLRKTKIYNTYVDLVNDDVISGLRDIHVKKCLRTDAQTDGRRIDRYTISSP